MLINVKSGGGAFLSTLNGGLLNKNFYQTYRLGFTLAEMMVVMLILSIIMAAMAPVMTTRNKLDQSAPWSWATNGSDAYYGLGDAQVAMIGQEEVKPTDDGARFIINSPSSLNHILFKNGDTTNGLLNMSNHNVFLGKLANGQAIGPYSTGLGYYINSSGSGSVSIGYSSSASGTSSVAIGQGSKSTVNYALANGYSNTVSGLYSIAIGQSNNVSGQDSIVLGRSNTVSADNSIGIGLGVTSAESSIAIGNGAHASGANSITISPHSYSYSGAGYGSEGDYSIAIGEQADAIQNNSIAIGNEAYSSAENTIAIGVNSGATFKNAIAIGHAVALADNGIAIGFTAAARGENNVAIGNTACKFAYGGSNSCLGYNSGPSNSAPFNDKDNVLYLGNNDSTVVIPGRLVVGSYVLLNASEGATVLRPANHQDTLAVLRADSYDGNEANLKKYDGYGNLSAYIKSNFYDVYKNSSFYFLPWKNASDRRLKYVGSESTSGLDKIRQLKVFNYTFKKDKKKVPHVGVIAQDLQKVFPNAVKKGVDGFLTIRMEDMFYAMINAIKELDSKISTLEKENKELKAALKQLQENNKKQEARLKALEAKIK